MHSCTLEHLICVCIGYGLQDHGQRSVLAPYTSHPNVVSLGSHASPSVTPLAVWESPERVSQGTIGCHRMSSLNHSTLPPPPTLETVARHVSLTTQHHPPQPSKPSKPRAPWHPPPPPHRLLSPASHQPYWDSWQAAPALQPFDLIFWANLFSPYPSHPVIY